VFKIKNNVFYHKSSGFYTLLDEGICWNNSQDKVFLLRKVSDNEIYAVPEYVFQMNFINMKKKQGKSYFKNLGLFEFEIKKLEKNYAKLLENGHKLFPFKL